MNKKVSVIIPVYNAENYISKCLDSMLNQSYKNIEILVINDGSTDKTEEIIKAYQENDNRIVYLTQKNNGPSVARNIAIEHSTGEYLVFIDSDDTAEVRYIELLLTTIEYSGTDIACCGYQDISEFGIINHNDFDFEDDISRRSFAEMVCKGTGGVLWGKIFKKDIINRNNLKMDKNIFMSEDLIFVLQYVYYCQSFISLKDYLYKYNRLNVRSISSNISMDYIENHIRVCEKLEIILNSLCLDDKTINQIISLRVKSLLLRLFLIQSKNLNIIGMKNAVNNIKLILELPYINQFIKDFNEEKIVLKPYIYFIRRTLVLPIIFYGVYLENLRCIKRIIKRKKYSL